MASVQRAFAQKLSKQHAADVRRNISGQSSFKSTSGCSSSISLSDLAEPLDYEDFLASHQLLIERDPLRSVLDFPHTDVEVCTVRRKIRTINHIVPEEIISDLVPHIQACIRCYTSDWRIVRYCFRQYSSSQGLRHSSRLTLLHSAPRQDFEIDNQYVEPSTETTIKFDCDTPTGRSSVVSTSSSSCATDATLTPRNSWASFDLRNSSSDPLLVELFDRSSPEELDRLNEARRKEDRQDNLFSLYPVPDDIPVERRLQADIPIEHQGHRVLVKCLMLKLELEVEPFFASMALYDAKEKKKLSENFYFDMNTEQLKRMLGGHIAYSDVSTLSRSAIFDITNPGPDLFIVVKLEKVLQGDINECAEPYMKDDKNRDKVKLNAAAMCERLGKYRQVFAWTAVSLVNVVTGVSSLERESGSGDRDLFTFISGTNSLERKSSGSGLEQLRRRATDVGGSLTRRGSLERRQEQQRSHSPDYIASALDTFRPITITVSSFFKQESDRLRDEDLYKFLQELKRPCSVMKKLKCIPGTLKLDISPCPEEVKCSLTTDLHKIHPYTDEKSRPVKELLEYPHREILAPYFTYRNLLFISPKELNFSNRAGSARNLAIRIQLMAGEQPHQALNYIFGKSSCPEFTNEAYTIVNYHNKCPTFYDEIKIKMPAALTDSHHILFTIYHISCQRKAEQPTVDTPVGYTWLPVLRDGQLVSGEFSLPVMLEPPPPNYSYIPPDVWLPGTKWIDNHKGVFNVVIHPETSIHTQDKHLEHFLTTCDWLETGQIPARIGESGVESELRKSLNNLANARPEALVKFLPLIFDFLLRLLVQPPYVPSLNQQLNVSTAAFETLCRLISNISELQDLPIDQHGRHSLLITYVQYQCNIPHPLANNITFSSSPKHSPSKMSRSSSNPDLYVDAEVDTHISRGLDRTASMRTGCAMDAGYNAIPCRRAHEELALQWVVSSGMAKDLAMANSWILFELIVKSMGEHLSYTQSLDAPRKLRFSDQFTDDVTTLVHTVTSEIISRYSKDIRLAMSLNCSLAFFLYDLLSLMDRGFVLGLVRTYCKQVVAKISSLPDAMSLIEYKLDFLRIISSHEHFIPLNLPFGTPYTLSSAPVSPNPSIASSVSQTSFLSGLTPHERINYAELSLDFRQQHFLIGLLLTDLTNVLDIQNPPLHAKVVDMIKSLLASHDSDPRYSSFDCRARVAALYLPLLAITMDSLPILYHATSENRDRSSNDDYVGGINQSVAMAIAGTKTAGIAASTIYDPYQQNRRITLNAEVTRNLLICFLWVVKNIAQEVLSQWLAELAPNRLQNLLQVLHVCISCFEYKGKKELKRCTQQNFRKTTDIKSRLEDVILGQGSARSEMMQRRKERQPISLAGDKLRWRKDQMAYRSSIDQSERPHEEIEADALIEGNLATEVSLTVLDTLEHIVQVVQTYDAHHNMVGTVFKVLLHGLARNQSTTVLQHMFATQRSLVFKFHSVLFDDENELCADLCLLLLRHCGSYMTSVRAQAAASLYLLMRQTFEIGNNFARIKMQVTMSLSSLVGTSARFSEESLRCSLKTILEYAENDLDFQDTTFPEQVRDLVFNLYMILSDTVKMKEFQEDPEMLLDLMYRIAKGYQNSPDLRLTWLANMAQKHMERNNHTEAGMCLIHSAALVAEYLAMQESLSHLPVGAVALEKVSPNVLNESAVSDDVLSPEQEGVCLGSHFTEAGLLGLLEHAASSFHTAGMYEAINDIYRVLIPIAEHNRDYKKLGNIHGKLHEAFTRIEQLHGKRVFGTYFRVGFYGAKFGDLNQEEFIYKEPTLTKLPEIFSRLENFYAERFGPDNVVIIQDSNTVDVSQLDPEKGYIQITYVEPYFEFYELRYRMTHFERNFNIKRFVYATPFTSTGRAHGELHEQYKRKTILTTAMYFPYVKTRIHVVDRKQIVLSPIEVAIEDIEKKTMELAAATQQEPPDPKILQMVLQGCIGTTVNQGPMEMAQVFLSRIGDGKLTKHQNKLRLCFKDFSKKCLDALKKNKNLIGSDQRDYQRELERNYHRFTERLQPLVNVSPSQVANTNYRYGTTNSRTFNSDSSPTPLRW